MANKKVQAQMQIDISFIGNTTKLFKDLEQSFSKLNLSSNLTKQIEADLSKGFRDTFANLGRMAEGLSKTGLSTKQYTTFFNTINEKVSDSTKIFGSLKKSLTDVYNSKENKQAVKDLENYKKQLIEINKIASQQKASQTRQNTAITKMKDETGIDYNISKRILNNIAARKANNQSLTKSQQDWADANGLNDAKLKRVLELLKQINSQRKSIEDGNTKAKGITGQSGVAGSISFLEKQIGKAGQDSISSDIFKNNIAILEKYKMALLGAAGASNVLSTEFDAELPRAQKEAEEMAKGMQTLNEVLSQFGIVLSAGTIVRAFKDIVTSAFEFYKSLDSALNEIYIVSNLSIDAVNNLKTSFIGMAKETGMALDDVTRSAVLFYQQGLNTNEVLEMTRVTSEFAKVAGIDATDAADKLTAAVNGYCLAAEDASLVADKFNKVAAASAADINELSTAFSKAAAQANQAGVSMDNYLAYIATMEEATREAPENIGTSLKTIFSRMQQVKEGGTTEDGETDVNKVETALKSVGIQLRDTEGQLRDLEDVFDELGPKWNTLDRNTQAYLGTIIAGTRQQSRFITLMQNWDRVLDLADQSANSAGQQALMHAKAMESIESKLQQFQVAWQEFISNLTSSDFFKGVVELLTKFVDSINNGATPVAILGTAIGLLVKNITKLDGPFGRLIEKFGTGFKKLKSLNSSTIKLAANYIKSQKSIRQYTTAISKSEKEISKLEKSNSKLIGRMDEIKSVTGLTSDELLGLGENGQKADQEFINLNNQVQQNNLTMGKHKQTIVDNRNAIGALVPTLDDEREAFNNVTDSLGNITVGLAGLSAILPGTLGSIAAAGSGITMIFSAAVQGIKTFTGVAAKGVKALSAAEKASVILTIISIGVQVVTGAITAIKALMEAFGNQDKNIAESVESMTDALEKYNNAATTAKAAKNLIKDYEQLANKVYLTAAEQEKLNDIAQQLGDSLDLEVIEDEYGNLSVSMLDVTDKMEALNKKAKEARDELIKTEHEQIEKFDHNGNVDKFYEEYLATSRSDIRTAMGDIETGIDTRDLATSAANVNNIMANLKNIVIDSSAEMSEAFGGLGIEWSLTEDVQSMIDAFNNADIDSSKWNDLYRTFDTLQEQIDSISYDQALETVGSAIKTWGEAAGLTKMQVEQMTDAIMDSLYSNSNLNKTVSKYQDILDQASGKTYETQLSAYEKRMDELEDESTSFWNPFKQDDAEKEYESVEKKVRLLKEEKQYYEDFKNIQNQINEGYEYGYNMYGNYVNLEEYSNELIEKYGFATDAEIKKAEIMRDMLGKFNDTSADWFDKTGLFDDDAAGLLENLQGSGALEKILGAYRQDNEEGTRILTDSLVDIINNTDDEQLREAAQNKLSNVFKNIQVKGITSWGELSDDLDGISEDLRNMNTLLEDFRETGGFTLDTFADLCDILDDIDLAAVFDAGKMDQFIAAIQDLELGFDASTGVITANGEALQSLGDIQQAITQSKLQLMAQSLEADKAQLQSQIYGIEAEIAANNDLIKYLQSASDAELAIDKVKSEGQKLYNNTMQQAASNAQQLYMNMAKNSGYWAEASIKNAAAVGDAIKAAMTGNLGTGNLSAYLKNLVSEMKYENTGSFGIIEMNVKDGKVDRDKAIAGLQEYNNRGQATINKLYSQMKGIEQMQGLLTKMSKADLSKFGTSGSGSDKDIDKYIGKLKEIYNILNRIQILEHRLSTLDSYADIATGEQYGNLLKERVNYNKELLNQYEFLTSEQKQFTNGYKDFINSVEGLEGVFDFDKFGQIIINWDKYTALQDEAVDGETTLKEKADDVYDTYTQMFEDLQGYFDNTIKYYREVIDLEQEMVDSYIEMENKAVEAVKEIYQKILDTKLEAIDKEKEAIEELRQAREQARKDQDNAKAVSGLQTNLQRAMMDTSGASDVALIKAQNDLDDKLSSIAEDKYSQMLDDIIEKLDNEQNSLQEEFDELWENMDWLYAFLEEQVMNDDARLQELLTQTDEWNTASALQRAELQKDWDTKYQTYMAGLQSGKTIKDVWDNIQATTRRIGELDRNLQTSISKGSAEIAQTIAGWQKSQSSSGGSGGSGGGVSSSYGGKTYNTNTGYTPTITGQQSGLANTTKEEEKDGYAFKINDTVRSNVGSWATGYDKTGGGGLKTPPKQWWGNAFMFGSSKATVIDRANYNGTNYYKIKFKSGAQHWLNGHQIKYKQGGFADFTGPAWLDGTKEHPEAVLNALQTEHFIKFTNVLDKLMSGSNATPVSNSSINIDNIQFHVDSMSSIEDGEKAFNMFVDKFKEIGNRSGIKVTSFKNDL